MATSHSGPWVVIEIGKVLAVIAVPAQYYKIPRAGEEDNAARRGGVQGLSPGPGQAGTLLARQRSLSPRVSFPEPAVIFGGLGRRSGSAEPRERRALLRCGRGIRQHAAPRVREGAAHRLHIGSKNRLPGSTAPTVGVAHADQRALKMRHHVSGEEPAPSVSSGSPTRAPGTARPRSRRRCSPVAARCPESRSPVSPPEWCPSSRPRAADRRRARAAGPASPRSM